MHSSEDEQTLSIKNDNKTQYSKLLINPLPVRIFHWSLVVSLSTAIISGLEISFTRPLVALRIIRFAHASAGLIALAVVFYRVGYAFISGDYKTFAINAEDIKTIPDLAKYYLFINKNPPPLRTKYNVGQKLIYLSWLLVILFLAFGGILLLNSFFITKGGVFVLVSRIILPQRLRMVKFSLTIYMVITIMLHIYLAHTSDIAKAQAMFTGWVRKKTQK